MKINDRKLLEFLLHADSVAHTNEEFNSVATPLFDQENSGQREAVERVDFDKKLKQKLKHPLDEEVLLKLHNLLKEVKKDPNAFYANVDLIKTIWGLLVEKSIIALRFFDNREPYQSQPKTPKAYGIEDLKKYFEKYADFEGLLYGSSKSYRDHVIHVFRTWLVGMYILLRADGGNVFIDQVGSDVSIDVPQGGAQGAGETETPAAHAAPDAVAAPVAVTEAPASIFNFFEKISMWTLTATCHDLGYPLEKAQKIFQKTNEMLEYFITNPKSSLDLSFSGVQDYINDYIVKFLSSKMVTRPNNGSGSPGFIYTGRVQPKYYIKFSKSLEKYSHGIVSSIILYKSLVYFLEAEFNVNEDYFYNLEECKQYYIRREILRAISTHTCPDIYHLSSTTFAFLLIISDDLQEWNRKKWGDFYKGRNPEDREVELEAFSSSEVKVNETIKNLKSKELNDIVEIIYCQYEYYNKLFRDGLDTDKRTFSFEKKFTIDIDGEPEDSYAITFSIPSNSSGKYELVSAKDINEKAAFYKMLKDKYDVALSADKKTVTFNDRNES